MVYRTPMRTVEKLRDFDQARIEFMTPTTVDRDGLPSGKNA
jgi:hypothetical protein